MQQQDLQGLTSEYVAQNSLQPGAMSSAPVIPTSSQYGLAIVDEASNPNGPESAAALSLQESQLVGEKADFDHVHNRFKVVKIVSTEPFRKGRWMCMDYFDQTVTSSSGAAAGASGTQKDTGSPQSHQQPVPVTPQPQQQSSQAPPQNVPSQTPINAQANQPRPNVTAQTPQQQPPQSVPMTQQTWTIQTPQQPPPQNSQPMSQSQGVNLSNTPGTNQRNWILSNVIQQNPGMMPTSNMQQPVIQHLQQQSSYAQQSQSNLFPQQPSSTHQPGFQTPTPQTPQPIAPQQSTLSQAGITTPQPPSSQLVPQTSQPPQTTNIVQTGQGGQSTASQSQSQPASMMMPNQQPIYQTTVQSMNQPALNLAVNSSLPSAVNNTVNQPISLISGNVISESSTKPVVEDPTSNAVPVNETIIPMEDPDRDCPMTERRENVHVSVQQPAIQHIQQPSFSTPSQTIFTQQNLSNCISQSASNIHQPSSVQQQQLANVPPTVNAVGLQQSSNIHSSPYTTTSSQPQMPVTQQANIQPQVLPSQQQPQLVVQTGPVSSPGNVGSVHPGQVSAISHSTTNQSSSASVLLPNPQQPMFSAPVQHIQPPPQNISNGSSIPNPANINQSTPTVATNIANVGDVITKGSVDDRSGGIEGVSLPDDSVIDISNQREVSASVMSQHPIHSQPVQPPAYTQQPSAAVFSSQPMVGNVQQAQSSNLPPTYAAVAQQQPNPIQLNQPPVMVHGGVASTPQTQQVTQTTPGTQPVNVATIPSGTVAHNVPSNTPQSLPAPIIMQNPQQPMYPPPAQSMTNPANVTKNPIGNVVSAGNAAMAQQITAVSGNYIAESIVKRVLEDQNVNSSSINDPVSGGDLADPESATGANTVAIDNKIEQAMDLVKSHLMFAVREEVEVLKEKIAELMDRISQLEYENTILKANASQETLAQIQSKSNQMHGTGGGGNAPSHNNNS